MNLRLIWKLRWDIGFVLLMGLVVTGIAMTMPTTDTRPYMERLEEVPEHEVFTGERSSKWPAVRAQFVRTHPRCEACGAAKDLNVHHIKPYHLNPELELDPTNLITLCREHHFRLGHLGNWSKANPNVRRDAESTFKKLQHAKEKNNP